MRYTLWLGAVVLGLVVLVVGICSALGAADFRYRWIGSDQWAADQGCNVNIAPEDQKQGMTYYRIWGGFHSLSRLLPASTYYQDHPEYFALVDGQRVQSQPCLSHPDVRRIVAENLVDVIGNDPDLDMVTLGLPDNRIFCQCSNCRALDEKDVPADQRYSRRVLDFYTAVADQVHAQHPDIPIRLGFYDVYAAPPKDASLPENTIPFICHFQKYCNIHPVSDPDCEYNARFQEIVRGWQEVAPELFIYEYYHKVNWLGMPWPLLQAIEQDIAWYKEHGVTGLYSQYRSDSLGSALNVYVAAHLLLNSQAEVNQLVQEFCRQEFGPAGEEMEAYFLFLEQAMQDSGLHIPGRAFAFPHAPEVFTPEVISHSKALLQKALEAAEGTQYEAAVEKYMTLMEYTQRCVFFLRLARQALGPGRIGVEEQVCHPEVAEKAFQTGLGLYRKLKENKEHYRDVVPRPGTLNPYLGLVLQGASGMREEE